VSELRTHAVGLLRASLGRPDADFRDGQWEAIEALVQERAHLLVVQRTGWGKSSVYFLTTRLLRERGAGPTILVSPLLALMRDQVRAAARLGVRAATIDSTNRDEWDAVTAAVHAGEVDILLVSPERLANDGFVERVLEPLLGSIGLFVVDEAHCISDWGHDFRPDYRRIRRLLPRLRADVAVLATTATANDAVVADITHQLGGTGRTVRQLRGPLSRSSLSLQAIHLASEHERMAWLAQHLPRIGGSGIVYVLTRPHARRVAAYLRAQGVDARHYTGGEPGGAKAEAEKLQIEDDLLNNRLKAVVATPALGMGFDKPDLAFVVHFQMPQSLIHYYQQVGRAGRAVDHALGVLLYGNGDREITDFFIRQAFPPAAVFDAVLDTLAQAKGALTVKTIAQRSGVGLSLTEKVLRQLAVAEDPPVRRGTGATWRGAGAAGFRVDTSHFDELTARRRDEQERMWDYAASRECLMVRVARELDDPTVQPCGRCAVCLGRDVVPASVEPDLVTAAAAFAEEAASAGAARRRTRARGTSKRRTTRSRAGAASEDGSESSASARPKRRRRTAKRATGTARTRAGKTVRMVDRSTAVGYVDQALASQRESGHAPEKVERLSHYRAELEASDAQRVDQRAVMRRIRGITQD
jgi:ATP-dependent DNA helicase RecQ